MLAGTRTRAPAYHLLHIIADARLGGAGGAHEIKHELRHVIRHRHATGERLRLSKVVAAEHRLDVSQDRSGRACKDFTLMIAIRIRDLDEEKETVLLRLRKRIRSFLFDGILRGQHEKRMRQREGLLPD